MSLESKTPEQIKQLKTGERVIVMFYNGPNKEPIHIMSVLVDYVFDTGVDDIVILDLIEVETNYLTRVDLHKDRVEVIRALNTDLRLSTGRWKSASIYKDLG